MTNVQGTEDIALETRPDAQDTSQQQAKDKRSRRKAKAADLWLFTLLSPYRKRLKVKSWLDLLAGIMGIPQAACLGLALDGLVSGNRGFYSLIPYAIALIGIFALRAFLSYASGRLGHKVSSAIRHSLREKLARTLAARPPLDTERQSAGEIAALGSDVIEALDAYICRYLSLPLQLSVIPLIVALAVASVSWVAALVLLACGPLIPIVMAIVGIRAKKASDSQLDALSDMSSRFLDRISGLTTLRLFRSVGKTRAEFEQLADIYRRSTMRVLRIAFLSSAALELFSALGIALIAIYVAYHYIGKIDFGSYGIPLTLGTGFFILMLAPDFFAPLREFAAAYHDKAAAQSAADRLRVILPADRLEDMSSRTSDNSRIAVEIAEPINEISFDHCKLGYGIQRGTVLHDVSCQFKTGEKVAILGASGAGKSTLLAALCGFLPPLAGEFTFNKQAAPQDQDGWDRLRQTMAWIGQKPHIFHGSLLMNARLANPQADGQQVTAALEKAHADRFVRQLPRDMLTILGETGFGISGGQIRRLAIARAILGQSSLVLCDEPTADLDAETATLVADSLMEMAQGRMLIVATHDRMVAERCDRIFYVHEGVVKEITTGELDAIAAAHMLEEDKFEEIRP